MSHVRLQSISLTFIGFAIFANDNHAKSRVVQVHGKIWLETLLVNDPIWPSVRSKTRSVGIKFIRGVSPEPPESDRADDHNTRSENDQQDHRNEPFRK